MFSQNAFGQEPLLVGHLSNMSKARAEKELAVSKVWEMLTEYLISILGTDKVWQMPGNT